jgi:gamma-aminobutyric acid type B receptor
MYHLLEGRRTDGVVAFLGAGCSSVTKALAQSSHFWNIPHFNFLSTSPALDDRQLYPTYYHVLPSENGLNPGRVALMKSLDWKNAVIFIETSDLFNLNADDLRKEMISAGLNQPEFLILPQDNRFDDTVQRIKETDIQILFGLFYEQKGRQLICELYKNGIHAPDHVWILPDWYSTSWYLAKGSDSGCKPEEMEAALDGYVAFDFAQLRPDVGAKLPIGKNVTEVAEEFQERANVTSNKPATYTFQKYSAYGYDTVLAMALLFHSVAEQLKTTGEISLLNNFSYEDEELARLMGEHLTQKNVSFQGLTGPVDLGNLLNNDTKRRDAQGYVEIRYCTKKETSGCVAVGGYSNAEKKLTLQSIPWTTNNGKAPVDMIPHRLIYASSGIFLAVAIMTGLFVIITIALLLFNIRHRNHWYMHSC